MLQPPLFCEPTENVLVEQEIVGKFKPINLSLQFLSLLFYVCFQAAEDQYHSQMKLCHAQPSGPASAVPPFLHPIKR